MDALITVAGAADILGLSRSTVYEMVSNGTLPARRIGPGRGRIRFTRRDLDDYIDASYARRSSPVPTIRQRAARLDVPDRIGELLARRR